jgi:hypothetical protein
MARKRAMVMAARVMATAIRVVDNKEGKGSKAIATAIKRVAGKQR